MYLIDARRFLPKALVARRVIFDPGWFGKYFYIYELDQEATNAIRKHGLDFFSYDPTPNRETLVGPGIGGVTWFATPMHIDENWQHRPSGYRIGTNGNHLPPDARQAYDHILQALNRPGNFYATNETSEAFLAIDVSNNLLLVVEVDD
ncbi:hypothetical protein [Asticcacaulis biprosthecium]|uniref:hypothetical protein n=1 Tax=Asticcacaulis biprosthecium TaxID=76891 RepID=UPI00058B5245|nr:hypothetical protein [Asticcacaulis biprosthecium]